MSKKIGTNSNTKGIVDWGLKKKLLQQIYSEDSDFYLAKAILNANEWDEKVERVSGSFKSWYPGKHNPTLDTGRIFLAELSKRINEFRKKQNMEELELNIIKNIIWKKSYDDFVNLIPKKLISYPNVTSNINSAYFPNSIKTAQTHYQLWISRNSQFRAWDYSLINGKIDQKFHYLSPESAGLWQEVISSDEYHQFNECKSALEEFCKNHEIWHKFCKESCKGVVMLGGGAPSKDILIMKSIAELSHCENNLAYGLVDFSYYMLESSLQAIDFRFSSDEKLSSRIELFLFKDDFLLIENLKTILRCEKKNIAWFLPGGTIGNIDERKFFDSIAREATPGDLLIIGVEILGDHSMDVIGKYESWAVKQLVSTPLRAMWHKLKFQGTLEEAIQKVEVRFVDGLDSGHSAIKETQTIEIFIPTENIVLATSSRYHEQNFIDFAASKFFDLEDCVPSWHNSNFKQFVFRYMPRF